MFRIGQGFDVHKISYQQNREGIMYLCGVKIEEGVSLEGHSDADVAFHAMTDAILGSISATDIGAIFSPKDERWKGMSSSFFLNHANDLLLDKGWKIINIDTTIICEHPMISKYRKDMIHSTSEVLGISESDVSIKGKTTETLGFCGRREGIAALSTVLVTIIN